MNTTGQPKNDHSKIEEHFIAVINTNKKKIKLPPGTLHYTGIYTTEHPRIECIRYNADILERRDIQDLAEIQDKETDVQWINITGLNDTSLIEKLGKQLDIHRINLEDIVDVSQRSKLEINGHYLFSIFKMSYLENTNIISEHVSLIVIGHTLITFQEKPGDIFDTVRERLEGNQGIIRSMGVDYLFFCLIDRFVDEYFISLQYVESRFADIEAAVIEQKNTGMDAIYKIRKDLLYLKNGVRPLKDILETIIRTETPFFSDALKQYFADVMDNTVKVYEAITTYREMVNALYEAQAANRNDYMNRKIMTLTVITVIFIPLSFLTGIFGMNFLYIPLLANPYSFIMFIVTCVVIVSAMLFYFKKKKWF